jgi:hypothetical protein
MSPMSCSDNSASDLERLKLALQIVETGRFRQTLSAIPVEPNMRSVPADISPREPHIALAQTLFTLAGIEL